MQATLGPAGQPICLTGSRAVALPLSSHAEVHVRS
jgi:hypothetical protein